MTVGNTSDLDRFFAPHSVAVVGATVRREKGGYNLVANLLESFSGPVYPVNPNYQEILGVRCYSSVSEIPEPPELAVVFVPARAVPGVLEDCGRAGVKAVVVESGGFAEVGPEGRRLEETCLEVARRFGIRVWGPNCTGLVNTDPFIFTPFMRAPNVHRRLEPGSLGIIAQSGMLAAGFMMQYVVSGFFKVSKACAIGNKMDIDEVEVLQYLEDDPKTRSVVAYLESVERGRDFLEVARKMRGRKPLVVLKGGRHPEAAKAALSHTASLAGSDEVVDGALKQAGVIRVHDFHDLMNLGKAFSVHPEPFRLTSPGGNGVALITVTGGGGVVATDLARDAGLDLARLERATLERLAAIFPEWMPPSNPVDIWPTVERRGLEAFAETLQVVLADERVDGVILLTFASRALEAFPFQRIGELARKSGKALLSWVFGDVRFFGEYEARMREHSIPVYTDLRSCVLALRAYLQFSREARSAAGGGPEA